MALIVVLFFFGLATAIVGKIKGESFFIWFVVGGVLPVLGLVAALLFRWEQDEPDKLCARCSRKLKMHDQVCSTCGQDLALPAGF